MSRHIEGSGHTLPDLGVRKSQAQDGRAVCGSPKSDFGADLRAALEPLEIDSEMRLL